MDRTMLMLALVIKQRGGTMMIEKKTFDTMDDHFEVMVTRNVHGNAVLTLVEGAELVAKIVETRALEDAKQTARRKLIVPE